MFESVREVLYRQPYGTKRPQVSEAERRRGRPRESEVAAQLGGSASFSSFPDGPTDADGLTFVSAES